MAIFNSYVKLPEGIRDSVKSHRSIFVCPEERLLQDLTHAFLIGFPCANQEHVECIYIYIICIYIYLASPSINPKLSLFVCRHACNEPPPIRGSSHGQGLTDSAWPMAMAAFLTSGACVALASDSPWLVIEVRPRGPLHFSVKRKLIF